jgi:hypothetical protein
MQVIPEGAKLLRDRQRDICNEGAVRYFAKAGKMMHLHTGNNKDTILKHSKKRLAKKCKGIIKI